MKHFTRIALGLGLTTAVVGAIAFNGLNQAADATPVTIQDTKPATPSGASTFAVDGGHSSMVFRIQHMGVANFMGTFNKFEGTYAIDPDDLSKTTMSMTVDANSVDSNSERRDGHIKSPDFFNVASHPNMKFVSTSAAASGDKEAIVKGNLTFLGVTKPVEVNIKLIGMAETRQGYKSGVDAYFTFKRSDFGNMTYVDNGGLGDEVEIFVSIEGVRQ